MGRRPGLGEGGSPAHPLLRCRAGWIIALWLLAGVLMWTSLSDDLLPLARVLWALAYGAVLIACALAIGHAIGRHLTRRRFGSPVTLVWPGEALPRRRGWNGCSALVADRRR